MRLKLFLVGFVLSSLFFWSLNAAQMDFENLLLAQITEPIENIPAVELPPKPEPIELEAKAAFSFKTNHAGRQRVVLKKNADDVLPIASLTKLMTAVVVMENGDRYDFGKPVLISKESSGQDNVPVYGNLAAGEAYTVKNLMEMMLLYSSNDAAYALSEVAGTGEFVGKMNQKAAELGLGKTRFYNPTGLDMENGDANRSSAGDLVSLSRYILEKHPSIFRMSSTPGAFSVRNGIFDLNLWDGQKLSGGKTGYTQQAGGCMVMLFEDSKQNIFINAILGARSSEDRVKEMQKLVNFINNRQNPGDLPAVSVPAMIPEPETMLK